MTIARHTTRSPIITVMVEAVLKAARGLVRDFGEVEQLQVSRKGLGDFVSTADHRSERVLIEELSRARPGYAFILEESGYLEGTDKEFTWIVDPLDGTNNFLHGIPYFSISVGLKKQDEMIAGVIYNPVTDELYYAEKGSGAYLNQRRLRVSSRRSLEEALIAFSTHQTLLPDFLQDVVANLTKKICGVRYFGSASLDIAGVASGRHDSFIGVGLKSWDLAAAAVIVREAGGYVTDFSGVSLIKPFGLEAPYLLASNEALHTPLLKEFDRK